MSDKNIEISIPRVIWNILAKNIDNVLYNDISIKDIVKYYKDFFNRKSEEVFSHLSSNSIDFLGFRVHTSFFYPYFNYLVDYYDEEHDLIICLEGVAEYLSSATMPSAIDYNVHVVGLPPYIYIGDKKYYTGDNQSHVSYIPKNINDDGTYDSHEVHLEQINFIFTVHNFDTKFLPSLAAIERSLDNMIIQKYSINDDLAWNNE